MKRLFSWILIICAFLSIGSCNKEDITGKNLRFICEELKPYSYLENNQLKGISADIVTGIMSRLNIDEGTVEITTDWDASLELAKTSDNIALFTTSLTANRKDKLQWVGPINLFITSFVGLKSAGLDVSSLNEAKDLPSIGVISGYPTTDILEKKNFDNIIYFNSYGEAIAALYAGDISSIFDLSQTLHMVALDSGRNPDEIAELFTYSTLQGFIAFSPGVSPKIVANWQEKLDLMKTDGTLQDIYDIYLPGVKAPGLVSVFTEDNPPQNYRMPDGSMTGSSVEMTQAIMASIGRVEPIIMTTWNDAMDQVMLSPNTMLFSMVKTPERDTLFQWVGPVCKKNYVFYVNSGGAVDFNTLEGAKQVGSIGVPDGWASQQQLIDLGFSNIKTYSTPSKVFQKLIDGVIDAAVLNDIAITYLSAEAGTNPESVKAALILSSNESYLAFSKDTKAEYVRQWQQALDAIHANGKFISIWNKWYPGIDW